MTKEELYDKHYQMLNTKGHTCISVEYAISVLEEVSQTLSNKFMTKSAKDIEFKIQQLKKIIS